ncbi:hypothetical protein BC830DRAFT_1153498 [Chytriomyces sp. MP71]|nr:hypothetical protein BC830DRAFT_1153498 [Chytriomyces sp. MP71]
MKLWSEGFVCPSPKTSPTRDYLPMLRESLVVSVLSGLPSIQLASVLKTGASLAAKSLGFSDPLWLVAVGAVLGFVTSLYALVAGFTGTDEEFESGFEAGNEARSVVFVRPNALGLCKKPSTNARSAAEGKTTTVAVPRSIDQVEVPESDELASQVVRQRNAYASSATLSNETAIPPMPLLIMGETVTKRRETATATRGFVWPPIQSATHDSWGATLQAPTFMDSNVY